MTHDTTKNSQLRFQRDFAKIEISLGFGFVQPNNGNVNEQAMPWKESEKAPIGDSLHPTPIWIWVKIGNQWTHNMFCFGINSFRAIDHFWPTPLLSQWASLPWFSGRHSCNASHSGCFRIPGCDSCNLHITESASHVSITPPSWWNYIYL